jgi:hypothetical protein
MVFPLEIQFFNYQICCFKTLVTVAELMTRITFSGTAVIQITCFGGIGFINMSFRNSVIRKLQGHRNFQEVSPDAFCQTVDVDISVVKRLNIIDLYIRKFLFLTSSAFSITVSVVLIAYCGYKGKEQFLKRPDQPFLNSGFNTWFSISHPDFYRNIYQLSEVFSEFFL